MRNANDADIKTSSRLYPRIMQEYGKSNRTTHTLQCSSLLPPETKKRCDFDGPASSGEWSTEELSHGDSEGGSNSANFFCLCSSEPNFLNTATPQNVNKIVAKFLFPEEVQRTQDTVNLHLTWQNGDTSDVCLKGEVKAKIKISPVVVFGVLSRMVLVRESGDASFLLESQSNSRTSTETG